MRVIEPVTIKPKKPRYKAISPVVIGLIVFAIIGVVGLYVYSLISRPNGNQALINSEQTAVAENDEKIDPFTIVKKPLKKLQGDDFKKLYLSVALPNTQEITGPPKITDSEAADTRIREWAEARGYKLSRIPMGAIVRVQDEPRLGDDDLLQPLAASAWYKLKAAAQKAGHAISLTSAYRALTFQRELFNERLFSNDVTLKQIANGTADDAIEDTLQTTAIPGYSRHHSGYTIDLWCEDGSVQFVDSSCFEWLSEKNYQNAMEFGWIPSYPSGALEQGPEPEPWEYVWVGDAAVRQP